MPYRYSANIFLSSTSKDLKDEREICVEAINRNYSANNMENWGASSDTVKEKIINELDKSAGVILILGFKYGSIMNEGDISYTEFEFDYAKSEGLPILSFIKLDETGEWRNDETDADRKQLLENFKSKIESPDLIVDYFGPEANLKEMVTSSLSNNNVKIINNIIWTDNFFEIKLNKSIDNLSERYNPEFNIDMKMDYLFDSISKNQTFKNNFKKEARNCYCNLKKFIDEYSEFSDSFSDLLLKFNNAYTKIIDEDFQSFKNLISISHNIKNTSHKVHGNLEDEKQKGKLKGCIYNFNGFIKHLEGLPYKLVENPFLLLVGDAGIGKSHLLANLAKNRLDNGKISILLLGSHFTNDGDIGQQMVKMLDLDMQVDEFLHYLNDKAKNHKSRILIMIDALNECSDKKLWKNHLNSFVNQIKTFNNLGLVISIRTTYEYLIPNKNSFLRYDNFNYDVIEAIKIFCKGYNIPYPSFPILYNEFSNPLFLKLMFDNISNNGNEIPQERIRLFEVINEFISRLDKDIRFDFDLSQFDSIVDKFINRYISCKISNNYVSYNDTKDISEEILRNSEYPLIDILINENLFSRHGDNVVFMFEKIDDYLTADYLLTDITKDTLFNEFKENGLIFEIINSNFDNYRGVFESLAVLLPEKFGVELFEIDFSDFDNYENIKESLPLCFIRSLNWREPKSVKENVLDYIRTEILSNEHLFDEFMDTIISLSYSEKFILNAKKLHEYLYHLPLDKRDSIWTSWTHNNYQKQCSSYKLIYWILSLDNPNIITKNSINLISLTLSWFLSSTNNELRDKSTYALIYLLKDNVDSLLELLKHFEGVNDLYIYERLFAVAYGVALRNNDFEDIESLIKYVYSEIFCKDNVYTHILLRDYARCIIEYGKHLNENFEFDESKLWMKPSKDNFEVPTDEENKEINNKIFNDVIDGHSHIFHSMNLKLGDFGTYVFESNFNYWNGQINVEDLQKIALKQIFDLYNNELHEKFDNIINEHRWNMQFSATERIGKKYQWIVFYNMLGIIFENYKLKDSWQSDELHYLNGPWKRISVRNFDPSINFKNNELIVNSIETTFLNDIEENWNKKIQEHINIDNLLIQNPIEDNDWLTLYEYITWNNSKEVTLSCNYDKFFEFYCQGVIVKKEDKTDILTKLNYERLDNFFNENDEFYQSYDREFTWSKAFNDLKLSDNYQTFIYQNFDEHDEVHIPFDKNAFELKYGFNEFFNKNEYKPTRLLFDNFNLQYGKLDNVLYSNDETMVIYVPEDNFWKLLINKKRFIPFLEKNNFDIIWMIYAAKINLDEKSIDFDNNFYLEGNYYLNNGELTGSLNETQFRKKFVGDLNSKIVHLSSCSDVESIPKANIKLFSEINDAKKSGFDLCVHCLSKLIK